MQSPERSRNKEYALWGLLLILLFGLGWFRGYRPEIDWSALLGKDEPLVVLSFHESWLRPELVQRLSKKIDREIRIEVIDDFTDLEARLVPQDSSPLVWLPKTWADAFAQQDLLSDFDRMNDEIREKVSPDFLDGNEEKPHFLPLLWAFENNGIRVEGFALPHGGTDRAAAIKALRSLLSLRLAKDFAKKSPAASTLRFLDEEDLPLEKKSRSLRDRGLRDLKTESPAY